MGSGWFKAVRSIDQIVRELLLLFLRHLRIDSSLRFGAGVTQTEDARDAVNGAQFVYTDVWVSMGQDDEAAARHQALAPYQVDEALMAGSAAAWFLHCLPAKRGQEVTDAVIDSPRSAVWQQARNRMHSARGAMAWMLGASAR